MTKNITKINLTCHDAYDARVLWILRDYTEGAVDIRSIRRVPVSGRVNGHLEFRLVLESTWPLTRLWATLDACACCGDSGLTLKVA
jgi:hypothetical protein